MTNLADGQVPSKETEMEYTEWNGVIMIPRIVPDMAMTSFVAANTGLPIPEEQL